MGRHRIHGYLPPRLGQANLANSRQVDWQKEVLEPRAICRRGLARQVGSFGILSRAIFCQGLARQVQASGVAMGVSEFRAICRRGFARQAVAVGKWADDGKPFRAIVKCTLK